MVGTKDLETLGFIRVGAIKPDESLNGCYADLAYDFSGHAVYALVVGGRIVKFGRTKKSVKERIHGHASALRGIMKDPKGHPLDPFKRMAPKVIRAGQEIEVWAKKSSASTYEADELQLNLKYEPEWVGRPG